jgi:hypothetical protein
MFLLPPVIFSFYPAWKVRKLIPSHIWSLIVFAIIAFTGGALLSAYARMFTVIVPIIVVWTSYILIQFVKIEIQPGLDKRGNFF